MNKPTILTHLKLITCIVQKGIADQIIHAATEAGAPGATVHYARGSGVREPLGLLGLAIDVEKEVVTIVVPSEQADQIFEKMYKAGRLDLPGMGFIYITSIETAATANSHRSTS